MPRGRDPFWDYVTPLDGQKWRCKFCEQVYQGGAARVKAHMSGIVGRGIRGCEKVDDYVKAKARDRMMSKRVMESSNQGVSEERIQGNVRAAPTSASHLPNVEGGTNLQFPQEMPKGVPAGASSSQYDQITVPHSNDPLPSCSEECVTETSSGPLRQLMDIYPSTETHVDLQVLEGGANMAGQSSSQALVPTQHQSVPHQCINHKTSNEEQNPAMPSSSWKNYSVTCQPRDPVDIDPCIISLSQAPNNTSPPHIPSCGTGLIGPSSLLGSFEVGKLLETEMVGEAFKRNTTKILKYLVGNQVSHLGIYGMGGVGKTAIMVHVHNRLLEKAKNYTVLWITVSPDFNPQRLQDGIWQALTSGKLQEKDVRKRAAMLSDCLIKRGKSIIMLDDVWECFDLKEVGIPVRADGIKLVLTTRSSAVCRQMRCEVMIKIEPLSQKEAFSLFLEELGSEVALNSKTEAVVKSIIDECAGLPLGVITMARSMRGVTDVSEWRDCLEKLRESSMGQTDMEKVLMKLQFSYDCLGNPDVQQCFLSCALYPEDELIDKFELIEFFIDQGLIGGLNTRLKQYDRGLTILSKLENESLLKDHESKIKMHNLIRHMALHIMSAISIVKTGKRLMRIPPEEYWTDDLEKVSLMENDIREFPLNMSPNCPKLSTCLLNRSLSKDVVIPDSFFKQLWGLKVLNLSGCKLRELPNSISDLVNLRALLLRECCELRCIPYLGKLISLRKLDICGCVHLEALEGLEMLVNLRYLDLTDTRIKRLDKGMVGGLLKLQYLKVQAVNDEDIANLLALETLQCHFKDVDDFNKLVKVIEQSNHCYYRLNVDQEESFFNVEVGDDGRFGNRERIVHIRKWSHAIVGKGGECTGICILIPRDVQIFIGKECDGTTNFSGMGCLENLELLNIEEWKDLQVLCGGQDEITNIHDSPAPTPTPTPLLFLSLRVLKISGCPKLKFLFGHGSKFYFPHLREIELGACEEMVGIIAAGTSLPPCPPPAFPSLEDIFIVRCDKMKRLVESEWLPHIPKLKSITVHWCATMEEIIGGPPSRMLVGDISLKSLEVVGCFNMKWPFPLELLSHLGNLQNIHVK